MTPLGSLLKRYARTATAVPAGADEYRDAPAPAAPAFNREAFRAELQALRRTNLWSMIAIVAMVVVLGIAVGFLIHRNIGNPPVVTSLFVGFGTVAAALTTVILALFQIKGQSDFLDGLARNLDGHTVQTIVDILARRL